MTRFQLTIRCMVCGNRYKGVVKAPDEAALDLLPDPPCPACKRKQRRRKFDYAAQKAPAVTGALHVRAVDQTAKIVMEDHKMTDLRSDVREGETMAPKLAPRLQAMADNMFARRGRARQGNGSIFDLPPQQVLRAAVSGRFQTPDTPNPIAAQHARRDRPPVHIIAGDGVRAAQ